MNPVDKDTLRFAALNITASLIANPEGLSRMFAGAEAEGITFPEHAAKLGKGVALNVLSTIEEQEVFLFRSDDTVAEILRTFSQSQNMPGRQQAEDRLTEGEMASNAIALIDADPSRWDGTEEDGNPFPGSGAQEGDQRIDDLMVAAFWLLGEIRRLERAQTLSDQLHAETVAAAADAAAPVEVAVEAPKETQH